MARYTSKRSIFFLTIVAARSGHNIGSQTEAFPLLHQQKYSLQLKHSSLSRESLFLRSTYRNIILHRNSCHSLVKLSLLFRDYDDDDYDENEVCDPPSGTIEDARDRFEEMISVPQEKPQHQQPLPQQLQTVPPQRTIAYLTHQITVANKLKTNPPPPPLTTILRERRINELNIINSLSSSDQAITDLWSLWFTERGTEAATRLLRAEELSSRAVGASGISTSSEGSGAAGSGEKDAQEAEALLWDLIEEHGVHWAEPVNRLATLMYMQGRLEESKALCEVVLSVKPWHIGALSGIVTVCMSMNDGGSARQWAEKRLPPLLLDDGKDNNGSDLICSRRMAWVARARRDAKYQLDLAEKAGRTAGDIGKREAEFRSLRTRLQKMDEANANSDIQSDVGHDRLAKSKDDDIWQ